MRIQKFDEPNKTIPVSKVLLVARLWRAYISWLLSVDDNTCRLGVARILHI